MKKIKTISLLAFAALTLTACSSNVDTTHPIGVGTGPNSLKLSPCAENTTKSIFDEKTKDLPTKIG